MTIHPVEGPPSTTLMQGLERDIPEERYEIPYGPYVSENVHHMGASSSVGRGISLHIDEDEKDAYPSPVLPLLPGEEVKAPVPNLSCNEELKVPFVSVVHAAEEEKKDGPSFPLLPEMAKIENVEAELVSAVRASVGYNIDKPDLVASLRPFITNYQIQSALIKELLEQNSMLANNLSQEEARANVLDNRNTRLIEDRGNIQRELAHATLAHDEAETALRERREAEVHEREKMNVMGEKVAADKRPKYTIKITCDDADTVRNVEVNLDRTLISSFKQEVTESFGGRRITTFTLKFRSHLAYYREFKRLHKIPALKLKRSDTKFFTA